MTASTAPSQPAEGASNSRYVTALTITVCLFFLWGMANNLNDILIAQFRKAFALSDFDTSLLEVPHE